MNKLIYIFLFLLTYSSSVLASPSYENALNEIYSVKGVGRKILMELEGTVEINGQIWKTLSGNIDGETFQVQIPHQRLFTTIRNGWGSTTVKNDNVYYQVASAVPTMKNVNGDSVMYALANAYSTYPYELQNGSIKSENGVQVIEVIAYNLLNNEIERVKAINSGNNLHIAMVKFPADQDSSSDEIFLGSFRLAQ